MRSLLVLPFFLFASVALADSVSGEVSLDTLNILKMSNLQIRGEAAETLYDALEVREVSVGNQAFGKIGSNLACFKNFIKGVPYHCSMIINHETGEVWADGVAHPLPAVGGANH